MEFKVIYRTEHGMLEEGYIVEQTVSKTTGRDRLRVVSYPSECDDPTVGRWIDAADVVRRH